MYLTDAKSEGEVQPDADLRLFEVKKSNYGPRGELLRLRFNEWTFVVEGGTSSLTEIASEAEADNLFLALLDKFTTRKVEVGCKRGANFAPSVSAGTPMPEGTSQPPSKPRWIACLKPGASRSNPTGLGRGDITQSCAAKEEWCHEVATNTSNTPSNS